MANSTITITYGEAVENHVGNQQIGEKYNEGISYDKLQNIKKNLEDKGYNCEFINLNQLIDDNNVDKNKTKDAGILIIRNFVNTFFKNQNKNAQLKNELVALDWDKKALMYKRVVNKVARWNLCFADFSQEPDYEKGKGRVYDFKNLEDLQKIRKFVQDLTETQLNAEGNYYYDSQKCYIGYHNDFERMIVIGLRLGSKFPIYYQWYKNYEPITKHHEIMLEGGDLYFMSDKAVGYDGKKKSVLTLKHAAGFNITHPKPKEIINP
jgi:hypothetical protein